MSNSTSGYRIHNQTLLRAGFFGHTLSGEQRAAVADQAKKNLGALMNLEANATPDAEARNERKPTP